MTVGMTVPGASIAGRDRPETFPDVPHFLTQLAATGLQDRLSVPEPDAGRFPRRLLDLADVFRSFPPGANMQDVDADELIDFLPSSRPQHQQLVDWQQEIEQGKPLPSPRGPDYVPAYVPARDLPGDRVGPPGPPVYPKQDEEWDRWEVTTLDPAWPMRPQVILPTLSPPLIDEHAVMKPWITWMTDRLEHVTKVMVRRRMQYAAAKVILAVKEGPKAPSKDTKPVASSVRAEAHHQLAAFSQAAVYITGALWAGLIEAGDVPVIKPAPKQAQSPRLSDHVRRVNR